MTKMTKAEIQEKTGLEQLLTVQECATYLELKNTTVYRLIQAGKIRSIKINNKVIRIPVSALCDYLQELQDSPARKLEKLQNLQKSSQ